MFSLVCTTEKNRHRTVECVWGAFALRTLMWKMDGPVTRNLSAVLNELSKMQNVVWAELDGLFIENLSIAKWIKNALL
uniref:Uncharacterized protein n=1 Tax=Caenorhabditis japonica TaxID=281687 RepID=A0A8R1IG82_CAEJA